MQEIYVQDKTFHGSDFSTTLLQKGVYDNCIFQHCNFNKVDISGLQFIDCQFQQCNLSLANVNKTVFRDVTFKDCKMLGLQFDQCHEFGLSFSFQDCLVNHCSFYKRVIKKTVFKNCDLQEVDFIEADVTGVVFDNCNLSKAVFENTILEKADLRAAYNYSIDPTVNKIKKAKFSVSGIAGLLDKYDIDIES